MTAGRTLQSAGARRGPEAPGERRGERRLRSDLPLLHLLSLSPRKTPGPSGEKNPLRRNVADKGARRERSRGRRPGGVRVRLVGDLPSPPNNESMYLSLLSLFGPQPRRLLSLRGSTFNLSVSQRTSEEPCH